MKNSTKWLYKSLPHEVDLKTMLSHRYESKHKLARAAICCRAVLLHLAYRTNESGHCWPNYATISAYTGFGKSKVAAAIKDLEAIGLIAVARGTGGNRNPKKAVNRYDLQLTALQKAPKVTVVEYQNVVVESQVRSVESQNAVCRVPEQGLVESYSGTVTKHEPDILKPDTIEPDNLEPVEDRELEIEITKIETPALPISRQNSGTDSPPVESHSKTRQNDVEIERLRAEIEIEEYWQSVALRDGIDTAAQDAKLAACRVELEQLVASAQYADMSKAALP